MKKRGLIIFLMVSFLWGVVVFSPLHVNAVSENTIRLYNVAGQGVFTLIRGVIQGKVKTFKDVLKTLVWGSAAGYGFYEAKKMIGNGKVTAGVMLANLSASISENVSLGDHPLAYIGYTIGPARIEIATPFAKKPQAFFNITASPADLVTLFYSLTNANRITFRNGLITFMADEPIAENVLGWTHGIYPTILPDQPSFVFNHEAVHAVQHLQLMSISPELFIENKSNSDFKPSLVRFQGLRGNALGSLRDLLFGRLYSEGETNWWEIEAYNFASDKKK